MLRKINEIYVTEVITFPRSGHTWLSRILKYYFKEKLIYCEKYTDKENVIDLNQNTNLQKNHDFDLLTEIKLDRKYLIQIRNRDNSLNSYYKLEKHNIDKNVSKNYINSSTLPSDFIDTCGHDYVEWIQNKRIYYNNFLNKWLFNNIPNSKLVIYEKLKTDTFNECKSILEFLTDEKIDDNLLKYAIEKSNVPHNVHFILD